MRRWWSVGVVLAGLWLSASAHAQDGGAEDSSESDIEEFSGFASIERRLTSADHPGTATMGGGAEARSGIPNLFGLRVFFRGAPPAEAPAECTAVSVFAGEAYALFTAAHCVLDWSGRQVRKVEVWPHALATSPDFQVGDFEVLVPASLSTWWSAADEDARRGFAKGIASASRQYCPGQRASLQNAREFVDLAECDLNALPDVAAIVLSRRRVEDEGLASIWPATRVWTMRDTGLTGSRAVGFAEGFHCRDDRPDNGEVGVPACEDRAWSRAHVGFRRAARLSGSGQVLLALDTRSGWLPRQPLRAHRGDSGSPLLRAERAPSSNDPQALIAHYGHSLAGVLSRVERTSDGGSAYYYVVGGVLEELQCAAAHSVAAAPRFCP